jgi:hypothetical protein
MAVKACFLSNLKFRFCIAHKDSTNNVTAQMLTRPVREAVGAMGKGKTGMGVKGKGKERASDDREPVRGMPIPPQAPRSTWQGIQRMGYVKMEMPVKREDISGDEMVSDMCASSKELFKSANRLEWIQRWKSRSS